MTRQSITELNEQQNIDFIYEIVCEIPHVKMFVETSYSKTVLSLSIQEFYALREKINEFSQDLHFLADK